MERKLEKSLQDAQNTPGVTACIVADKSGLCLGATGDVSRDSTGLITAIANQVSKLEPGLEPPAILLQNDLKKCMIQRHGPLIGAVFRDTSQ